MSELLEKLSTIAIYDSDALIAMRSVVRPHPDDVQTIDLMLYYCDRGIMMPTAASKQILKHYLRQAQGKPHICLSPDDAQYIMPAASQPQLFSAANYQLFFFKYFQWYGQYYYRIERDLPIMTCIAAGMLVTYLDERVPETIIRKHLKNIKPGFDVATLARMLADFPSSSLSWRYYRILMGTLDRKYSKTQFLVHPLKDLRAIIQSFPIDQQPRVAMQLACSKPQFIYENASAPFMYSFLSRLTAKCLNSMKNQPCRVIDKLPADVVHRLMMLKASEPWRQPPMNTEDAGWLDAFFTALWPIIPDVEMDLSLTKNVLFKTLQFGDYPKQDTELWIKHFLLTTSDGYYRPVPGASRLLRLLPRLPINFIEMMLKASKLWRSPQMIVKPDNSYEAFLQAHKWIAFL